MNLLVKWFEKEKRQFPWRDSPTPYHVLVSEVMLQQTQASRVVPYFLRWIIQFPTLKSVADSSEEVVMKAWEGLGYYSRARSLKRAAECIQYTLNGTIPNDLSLLLSIPGIGPYTAGAIRSFAFHEREAAVDANVERVIARWFDLPLQKGTKELHREVTKKIEVLLPEAKPWQAMEALIELGALVCAKIPLCTRCPLKGACQAYRNEKVGVRPLPKKSVTRIHETRIVFLFEKEGKLCVVKRTGRGAMSGLWELPYVLAPNGLGDALSYLQELETKTNCIVAYESLTHSYTKYVVTLFPYHLSVSDSFVWTEGEWIEKDCLLTLPFSAGHKRVLEQFIDLI